MGTIAKPAVENANLGRNSYIELRRMLNRFHFQTLNYTFDCTLLQSELVQCLSNWTVASARISFLYRLRWNVLAALDDIEIATGPEDQTTNLPFLGHPLADDSLAEPPLSRIQVCIHQCEEKNGSQIEYPEEIRYQPPPALVINNEDSRPITLGKFVTEVHKNLNRNIEEIKKVMGELHGEVVNRDGRYERNGCPVSLPDNNGTFLMRVWAVSRDDDVTLGVSMYAEGERSWSVESF